MTLRHSLKSRADNLTNDPQRLLDIRSIHVEMSDHSNSPGVHRSAQYFAFRQTLQEFGGSDSGFAHIIKHDVGLNLFRSNPNTGNVCQAARKNRRVLVIDM